MLACFKDLLERFTLLLHLSKEAKGQTIGEKESEAHVPLLKTMEMVDS